MKIHKVYIAMFITILLMLMTTTVSAENMFTITDETEDVLDVEANTVSYPDLDIKEISIDKTGNQVYLNLELVEDGKILDSGFIVAYSIYLTTNKNMYEAMYSYSEADLEELGLEGNGVIVTAYENQASIEDGVEVNVKSYSGIGTNKLTISFDLLNSYERCLSIDAVTMFMSDMAGTKTYIDELVADNSDFPSIDAGGKYYGDAGEKITFEGSIDEGSASSYNWLWTIDGTSITKEGQTAQHTFVTPGTYTGTLYVYDGQGHYSDKSFTVQVNGTSSNGGNTNGGSNNQPGFEILAMFAAIAIALIILKKKK